MGPGGGPDPIDGLQAHLAQAGPLVGIVDPGVGLADLPVGAVQKQRHGAARSSGCPFQRLAGAPVRPG